MILRKNHMSMLISFVLFVLQKMIKMKIYAFMNMSPIQHPYVPTIIMSR